MTVISHTTPKISPLDGGRLSPYVRSVPVGNDPGWIIVETASGGAGFIAGEDPPPEDDGSQAGLTWGYGAGELLSRVPPPLRFFYLFRLLSSHSSLSVDGSSVESPLFFRRVPSHRFCLFFIARYMYYVFESSFFLRSRRAVLPIPSLHLSPRRTNFPDIIGLPTPDPALLLSEDDGTTAGLKWNYPPGGKFSPLPWAGLIEPFALLDVLACVGCPALNLPLTPSTSLPFLLRSTASDRPPLLRGANDKHTFFYIAVPTPDPALAPGGDDASQAALSWNYPPGKNFLFFVASLCIDRDRCHRPLMPESLLMVDRSD